MGSRVFWLVLSLLLILVPAQAQTGRTRSKDAKEDVKRRRQHARRQTPISLKPPPQDWPEPELNAGDFLLIPKTEATSLSPLLAYQAKLEQEYLRQKQDAARGKRTETPKKSEESVKWTSSEEDLKKLLNPDELLKHNKPLKAFVADEHSMPGKDQGKSAAIKSLAAMKAGAPKRKKKTKPATSKVTLPTTKKFSRRGRKRKSEVKNEYAEDLKPLKELKKQRVKSKVEGSEEPKTRKRRKKSRKFAFSNRSFDDGKRETVKTSRQSRRAENVHSEISKESSSTTITVHDTTTTLSNSSILEITTTRFTPHISTQTTESTTCKPITRVLTTKQARLDDATAEQIYTEPALTTKGVQTVKTSRASPQTYIPLRENRDEIRNKRKEMKEEMAKVLKAEQLEGSFSDNSSAWTTSEEEFYVEYNDMRNAVKQKIEVLSRFRTTKKPENKRKIPIHLFTPRHGLLGLFKHNMDTFISKVFRESAKLTEETD